MQKHHTPPSGLGDERRDWFAEQRGVHNAPEVTLLQVADVALGVNQWLEEYVMDQLTNGHQFAVRT
jgi:hypothetical protein